MSNLSTLFDRYKALVVFDTETSGLDFDNDQIIELAALRVERTATGGLRIAGKMDTFIKLPEGEALPENIVSLTGITDEQLQRALKEKDSTAPAPPPEGFDVVDQLSELLAERKKLHIIDEENLRYNCDIIALEYAIGALRR